MNGPVPLGVDGACGWANAIATGSGVELRFVDGWLCAGCQLSGGSDGTSHVLMQQYRLPLDPQGVEEGQKTIEFCG